MKPWIKVLLGLFLAIIVGLIAKQEIFFVKLIGIIFINILKMLVGFIVFASIVPGICNIHDPKKLNRIGCKTLLYSFFTTLIAISFGLLSSFFLQAGIGLSLISQNGVTGVAKYSFLTFITSLIPASPIASFAEGMYCKLLFSLCFLLMLLFFWRKGKTGSTHHRIFC